MTFADNLATQLAYRTADRLKKLGTTSIGIKNINEKRDKIREEYSKKKMILAKYLHSAPFTRLHHKITFIIGVLMVIFQSFFLGRYPNTFYYTFHTIVLSLLVLGKWIYYKSQGWHYFMTDFCYASNSLLLVYLNFYPKCDELFKVCFFYSNGALAVSVGAFRNQMVFHNYDNMSSLALHIFPIIVMWNLRWNTMPYEETLTESERHFLSIDTSFDFNKFFIYPMGCYFIWVSIYFVINFVVAAKRIRDRNYDNLFLYYEK